MLGAASLATGVQRVSEALFRGRSDMTPWPSAARVIRAWLPAVIWRATVTSMIERLIAQRRT
jgi:hypothetical protein